MGLRSINDSLYKLGLSQSTMAKKHVQSREMRALWKTKIARPNCR